MLYITSAHNPLGKMSHGQAKIQWDRDVLSSHRIQDKLHGSGKAEIILTGREGNSFNVLN